MSIVLVSSLIPRAMIPLLGGTDRCDVPLLAVIELLVTLVLGGTTSDISYYWESIIKVCSSKVEVSLELLRKLRPSDPLLHFWQCSYFS